MRSFLVALGAALLLVCSACAPSTPGPRAPAPPPGAIGRPPLDRAPTVAEPPAPEVDRPPAPPPLRFGTWNVTRLGHGTKRLDLVARAIEELDVVALQEVMTPEGVDALLAELSSDWRAVVSELPVGRGHYREHYALLYRASVARVLTTFTPPDPEDAFERDPFVVCLVAAELDFCVVTIHVIFGRTVGPRDQEVRALAALVHGLRDASREKDWLVAGDFNRPGKHDGWSPWRRAGWVFTDGAGATRTSVGQRGYRSAYDHILLDPHHTREWDGHHARVDIVTDLCNGDASWCRTHVSDHAPIRIQLDTAGPDDD